MNYDLLYEEIQNKKIAEKQIRKNFLDLSKEELKPIVRAIQNEHDKKIAYIKYAYTRIYQIHKTGGPLHIVLDDLNINDADILYCLKNIDFYYAEKISIKKMKELKELCTNCAIYLLELSYSKRNRLLHSL